MFVGELEFSDIPIDPDSKLSWLAFSFLVTFVFLIVVILMNLLNGLAVSDTGLIMEQAEIVSYISRVETISHLESILLGDPFDFLTNWPPATFLARLPAMALCYQVNLLLLKISSDIFRLLESGCIRLYTIPTLRFPLGLGKFHWGCKTQSIRLSSEIWSKS